MSLLTKSKYMNGLQCPRLLWHAEKKLMPELSLSTKHKFAQGHDFEKYVKKLYPSSIDLDGMGFKENLEMTKRLVEEKKTIFEASFMVDDLFVRSDLIIPSGDKWDLYEVKSTTQSKDVHIPDLAFQKYVLEKAGLKVDRCFLIFLNKEYVKDGEIDPSSLVIREEVTEKVDLIDIDVEKFFSVMNGDKPDICISQNCNNPYECALKKECWSRLPSDNVLQLTNWRVYWKLFSEGVYDMKDIPSDVELCPKDEIIVESIDKSPYVSKEHIKDFLDKLNYPLFHFDFETFDTAVPIFDKTRPYQKIPFQYSLHIESADGSVEHKEFLSEGGDPREELLVQMKKDLEGSGDIVVFNKSFEISILNGLAEDFPSEKDWLDKAIDRIVDLADVFRNFWYYDRSQKGSYSIKKVLPALTGKSYDDLEIKEGSDASMLYFYSHIKPAPNGIKLPEKAKIRENLIKYCCLDTQGMIMILDKLKGIVG